MNTQTTEFVVESLRKHVWCESSKFHDFTAAKNWLENSVDAHPEYNWRVREVKSYVCMSVPSKKRIDKEKLLKLLAVENLFVAVHNSENFYPIKGTYFDPVFELESNDKILRFKFDQVEIDGEFLKAKNFSGHEWKFVVHKKVDLKSL